MLRKLRPIILVAVLASKAMAQCDDPKGACAEPCPAEESCYFDEDCGSGLICVPCCLPGFCFCCDGTWCPEGQWNCSLDCAGKCVEPPPREIIPTYKIVDLGTLGGLRSNAHAINNLGQVVGEADTSDGYRRAFLWSGGTMRDLGLAEAYHNSSWAQDINNLGDVALNSGVCCGWKAYIVSDDQWTNLAGIGVHSTEIYALNDSGVAAGISTPSGLSPRAMFWEEGVTTDLTALGYQGLPRSINSSGAIVGGSLWYQGDIVPMPPLTGSGGRAINDRFQVTGSYPFPPDGEFHAFLWTAGSVIDIGALISPKQSSGEAINIHGDVVGFNSLGDPCPDFSFLYTDAQGSQDLLSLVSDETQWRELQPQDINDLGQIVGKGDLNNGLVRAFLMTPIYADFNRSGDTDVFDLGCFAGCMDGPAQEVPSGCVVGDADRDDDADLRDYWVIHRVIGPGSPGSAVSNLGP